MTPTTAQCIFSIQHLPQSWSTHIKEVNGKERARICVREARGKGGVEVGRQPSLIGSVVNPVAHSSKTIVANGILISSKFAKIICTWTAESQQIRKIRQAATGVGKLICNHEITRKFERLSIYAIDGLKTGVTACRAWFPFIYLCLSEAGLGEKCLRYQGWN